MKRYKSTFLYAFMVGFVIGSMPFFYKLKESIKVKKLIQEQQKIEMQNKEKICKEENSDYKKFLSLGFPKTALEKFYICMNEQ